MPIERVFLGWDSPFLPRAAAWLRQRYERDGVCDMGSVIIVAPGRRASRRLLELLTEEGREASDSDGSSEHDARLRVLVPPRAVTPGELPEQLYTPAQSVADEWLSLLARVASLHHADTAALAAVAPHRPGDDDWPAWLALARDLDKLHESLAAELVTVADVAPLCRKGGPFIDEARWDALAALQQQYEQAVRDAGYVDQHAARRAAIDERRCGVDRDVVLLATAELSGAVRAMLQQVAPRVTALVFAPPQEADAFDELGGLRVEQWGDRAVDIDPSAVHVVDRPRDQAIQVLQCLAEGDDALGRRYAGDEVTIGLGDEAMGSAIERTLELADVPVRPAVGPAVSRTRPVTLLRGMAALMTRGRFSDLASVLRHPDIERYLGRVLPPPHSQPESVRDAIDSWLTLLDEYLAEHVQGRLTESWLGDAATAARLKAVYDTVLGLCPADAGAKRPLPHWRDAIAAMLMRVYEGDRLSRHDDNDAPLIESLETIGGELAKLTSLPVEGPLAPRVTCAEAIAFVLDAVADRVIPPPQSSDPTQRPIELVGWLELPLDDAPALIITGVNEGHVPQSVNADAFLPDALRSALGLIDNRKRYARDVLALTTILHSRPEVRLITGRRDADNNPITPSRLLLACDGDELVARVRRFYGDDDKAAHDPPPLLMLPGGASRFILPVPLPPEKPLDRLRVTAFRDYLACPYRFYLRHILRLDVLDDDVVELDGAAFGSLAHDVLAAFGRSDCADATDAGEIADFLSDTLDRFVALRHGSQPPAAIVIQTAQMRDRLRAFADWQAMQVREGWRILREHVELSARAPLPMDDAQPAFTITGRIDRIDEHPELGYRLLDYKTADTPTPPERAHRQSGDKGLEWIDLQLPLYRTLAASLELDITSRPVQLGYVQLPKDLSRVGFDLASWSDAELDEAEARARWVVERISGGVFWPPTDPPTYADGFELICMDDCLQRGEAIRATESKLPRRRGGTRA